MIRDAYAARLNELIIEIFQAVMTVEEQTLKNASLDISISELHTLEVVGKHGEEGSTISAIAQELDVTLPTVTVCVKRLEKKEYVEKVRDPKDGRVVRIVLTRKGRKVDASHRYFHEQMIRAFIKEVDESERPVLMNSLENLKLFLDGKIKKSENPGPLIGSAKKGKPNKGGTAL